MLPNNRLQLLTVAEAALRLRKVQSHMRQASVEAALLTNLANIYYLTGRIFVGFVYIPAEGEPTYFVQRPVGLEGERVEHIRKPEEILERLAAAGTPFAGKQIGLELDAIAFSTAERLRKAMGAETAANISPAVALARSRKTPLEVKLLRQSGVKHEEVYRRIPRLYSEGMTDLDLQIEIERLSRQEGCLGLFRVAGQQMELFMANIICGDNADAPSPYDFAMGGAGIDPSLPVGASGETIRRGMAVMVDVNGNYTGYMTDMTRTFSRGDIGPLASKAHQCSIDINRRFQQECRPGAEAKALYEMALDMARQQGLDEYFMGHRQHAGFVGHGIGIEVNELPVIAPRSRHVIEVGNVIALEPKFVIPGVGAVGIENTYYIGEHSTECLTNAPEQIISLD